MTIDQAAALLRTPRIEWARPQIWCDLGCGEGVFTMALASLLAPGSSIHAVDADERAFRKVSEEHGGVPIRTVLADVNSLSLSVVFRSICRSGLELFVVGKRSACRLSAP